MPVIPALGRLKQEDPEIEASLGYILSSSQKNKLKHSKYKISSILPQFPCLASEWFEDPRTLHA
jgi:hypothetical protein